MAEFTGKTIEEAIEVGLKELKIEKEAADIKILDEPNKGFLGINSKKARVDVTKKASDGERALNFLKGLFGLMSVKAGLELAEEDERVVINLTTENSSSLIGYRGEVLDAFQCLAGAVANTGREDYRRVVVDCEGYRQKREDTLVSLAKKLAEKAIATGRKLTLEPMNPYERRIIHSALADNTKVKTQSEGKEPNGFIAIIPENYKPSYRDNKGPYKGGRPYNGGFKKYDKDGRGDRGDRGGRYSDRNLGFRKTSGFSGTPRPKTSGFGTFIGNSMKDTDKDQK